MKSRIFSTMLLIVAFQAHAANSADEAALAVVTELGQLNGRALACSDMSDSARAKALMLRHAPRTQRYGDAFEQATQQGFLSQVKAQSAACPDAAVIAQRMDAVAKHLREVLPEIEAR